MVKSILLLVLAGSLGGCVMPEDDGIPRIRNQRDVDAYNATVSSPGQKLECTREVVMGTNFREYVCLTVAQKERMAQQAQDASSIIFDR